MPYRDSIETLRARRVALREEHAELRRALAEIDAALRCATQQRREALWMGTSTALRSYATKLVEALALFGLLTLIVWPRACALPLRGDHRPNTARNGASAISSAATIWLTDHPRRCPTVADLLASGDLPPSRDARDPWGGPYEIVCAFNEISVHSAGPDRLFGTADDIIG